MATSLLSAALLAALTASSPAQASFIEPSLHALTWKHNGTDFWAPVHLQSSVHYLQSPAGALPSSLSRRDKKHDHKHGQKQTAGGYVGCTVATLPTDINRLTAAALEEIISTYASTDDVWSAEQFLGCLYIQHNGTDGSVTVDKSVSDFIKQHGIDTLLVSKAFQLRKFKSTASHVYAVEASCNLENGPYVATLPTCEGESLGMAPVYTLHADHYEGQSLTPTLSRRHY